MFTSLQYILLTYLLDAWTTLSISLQLLVEVLFIAILTYLISPTRFIEGNKIEEINKYAFRGLRDITHM